MRTAIQFDVENRFNVATCRHRTHTCAPEKSIEYSKCIQLESAGIHYCSIIQRGWRYILCVWAKRKRNKMIFRFPYLCVMCDVMQWSYPDQSIQPLLINQPNSISTHSIANIVIFFSFLCHFFLFTFASLTHRKRVDH